MISKQLGLPPSPSQLDRLNLRFAERLERAFNLTEPLDQKRLTDCLAKLYTFAERKPPRVVFCRNPQQVCALSIVLQFIAISGCAIKTWSEFDDLIPEKWWHDIVDCLRRQKVTLKTLLTAVRVDPIEVHRRLSPTRNIPLWPQIHLISDLKSRLQARVVSQIRADLHRWELPPLERERSREIDVLLWRLNTMYRQLAANLQQRFARHHDAQLRASIFDSFERMPRKSGRVTEEAFAAEAPETIWRQPDYMFWGAVDCIWISYQLALYDIFAGENRSLHTMQLLEIVEGLYDCSSAMMMLDNICIVSERAVQASFDQEHRLHAEQGPALVYGDDYLLYSFRGVTIPSDFVEDRSRLTANRIIDEQNTSSRRALIEVYGMARFIVDSGGAIVDEDEHGVLYRQTFANDEPLVMLKVINSTPEPDGSYKEYFLRVPPAITTAREAVAWTFGLQPERYVLAKQT